MKKEKTSFLLCFLLWNTCMLAQQKVVMHTEDVIFWSESRGLVWNDFKKEKSTHDKAQKIAKSQIGLYFIPVFDHDKNCSFEVLPYFNTKNSITTTYANSFLLKHEQYHFNIAELLARKFRKEQAELGDKKTTTYEYQRMIDWCNTVYKSYQDNYDRQTKHGADLKKQKHWEKKIDKALKELTLYKFKE